MFILLLKILIALFGFSILVFFHELGHFLIAKLFKIKVNKFSIGMGPALWGFKKGETFFQIGTIPFGGFCQFKGDELKDDLPLIIKVEEYNKIYLKLDEKEKTYIENYYKLSLPEKITNDDFVIISKKLAKEEKELFLQVYGYDNVENSYVLVELDGEKNNKLVNIFKSKEISLVYKLLPGLDDKIKKEIFNILRKKIKIYELREPDTFFGSPPYKRLIVAFFGPFMNYLVAISFFTILSLGSRKELVLPTKIMLIDDLKFNEYSYIKDESSAKAGGLKTGDIILKIDDKEIKNFFEISEYLYNKNNLVKFEIKRDNEILIKFVKPRWNPDSMRYTIGILSYLEPIIANVKDAKLHEYLDLKDGDVIIGIDEYRKNITADFISEYLKFYFGKNKISKLYINRDGKEIVKEIVFNEVNRYMNENEFRLFFKYPYKTVKETNVLTALFSSVEMSFKVIKHTGIFLYSLIFKPSKNIIKHFGGPIMIGAMISEATISGFQESIIQGIKEFLNFVAMISLALAIFNLLPIPALDGGHILLSLVEIVTRRSISLKLLYIINMLFFVLLMTLGIFFIFIDISRLIK